MKRPPKTPSDMAIRCAAYLRARGWRVIEPARVNDLHRDVMNIPCEPCGGRPSLVYSEGYRAGHRDARHAAAELVVTSGADDDLA